MRSRPMRRLAPLLTALVLTLAGLELGPRGASAQIAVIPQWWDGSARQTITPSTPLPTKDFSIKDREFRLLQPSAISAQFVRKPAANNGGSYVLADSSTAIDTRGYTQLALMLYPTLIVGGLSADTCSGALFALAVRGHYSAVSDSQNTFVRAQRNPAASTTQPDSIGSLADIALKKYDNATALPDSAVAPNEVALLVPNVAHNPRGFMVFLNNRDGSAFTADFTSISLRIIHTYKPTTAGNAQALETGSGNSLVAQRIKLRVDVWGAR